MSSFDIYVFRRIGRAVGRFLIVSREQCLWGSPALRPGSGTLAEVLSSPCREVHPAPCPLQGDTNAPQLTPQLSQGSHVCLQQSLLCPPVPGVGFPVVPAGAAKEACSPGKVSVRHLCQSWAGLTLFKELPCLVTGTQS